MKALCFVGLFLLGSLVAFGDSRDGQDPVVTPEPGTIVLFATGLAGIGLAAWRRNRKR